MPNLPEYTFDGIAIYRRNHVWVNIVNDELAGKNVDHTAMYRWLDGEWGHKNIPKTIRATCFLEEPSLAVYNMAIDGQIVVFTLPGTRTEQVDASDEGPSDLVHLRAMRRIGDHLYVAGMARRVYRRDSPGRWTPIDGGVFVPRDERTQAVGFNAIDGFSETDIYAAGYAGEIWHFDGKKWMKQDSPTNLVFNCILCAPDGETYVCGMSGVILRGSSRRWRAIEQDVTSKDFWGMCGFREKVYLANYDGVFVLDRDDLSPVGFGLDRKLTTAYLHAADGVMWSAGQKDLASTIDGVTWVEIEGP